ncbi:MULTISPECIES: ABC transporter permease [Candidatus Accumulibacter]|uniref:Macrolide export ATP-binding/permease protein MacB n=2 Tax=Candidatus Accumulibacter TaxID=327159 RepID=A0A080M115_9PROT|nr:MULTISPECIES: ABC transporter permease [Candidatus Accumulibacter]KFB74791.1 MAG: Macrolide export ATP-binding/permease protein MacB [Candidatus Accumulibacter cognatus]MBL8399517.1 ABC transporter permease [Accumulibacter sp.]MBN8518588.1 ABC transporter permease [Accumulibacter sp.]MCC2868411.1 ABC transporter permease [Candidatus Accumulibacter phosphatis]TMQ75113.1 ABC-type antimicrobial peptide transport system, permease component [Candidatus Accumulibacter phosphatis]
MKGLPLAYIVRNLWVRRVTTVLTALGMALVVYVFATVLMMSEGIRATLVATGQADNVIVLRKGAGAEINSAVTRDQAGIIETLPGIARDTLGRTMVSREPVVLINLPKRGNGKPSNVTVRGTSEMGGELRPQVRISEGRMFRPGTSEIVAGSAVAAGFQGVGLGQTLRFAGRDWLVVGIVDAGRSGFDSELWGDGEQMLQAFRRNAFSTVVLRLADVDGFEHIRKALEDDPRLSLEAKPERVFYAEQSEALATFIRLLGTALAAIFSIGAMVGAMITMFAAVAARTAEIGTLRALGFRRRAVLLAFLGESLLLATLGGVLGLAGASAMQAVDISTTNFQTFAELAFRFVLTPSIALQSMAFALAMGVVGGFVPAWRAARLEIADCLRAA